jgi:hypothetical protein
VCDDRIACTVDDHCDPELGCVNTPDHTLCPETFCGGKGICDPSYGCVYPDRDDSKCVHDDPCATGNTCDYFSGECTSYNVCEDGYPCTLDICIPRKGRSGPGYPEYTCSHTPAPLCLSVETDPILEGCCPLPWSGYWG